MIKRWLANAKAHPALLVFVLAFVLRLIWVATLKPDYYWGDERSFAKVAHGLAEGKGYLSTSYRANPVLPFYLSLVFRTVGENLLIARIGQSLFGALTCLFICQIATLLINERVGLISGLALAAYPQHIYLSGVFYAECLMIFWGALGLYLAALVLARQPRLIWALLAGIAIGLAVLSRSTLAFWLPCTALAFLYQSRYSWATRFKLCVFLVIGGSVTILPWTFRNYQVYGQVIPVSSGFGTSLWQANNPFATGGHGDWYMMPGNVNWSNAMARLPAAEQQAVNTQYAGVGVKIDDCLVRTKEIFLVSDKLLMPYGLHYLIDHPGLTLERSFRRFRLMFSAYAPTESSNEHTTPFYKIVAAITYYPILVLAICGMVQGLRYRKQLAIVYLCVGVVIFVTMLLTGTQTRYRLPIDPYLIIFAAIPVAGIISRFAKSSQPAEQMRDVVSAR